MKTDGGYKLLGYFHEPSDVKYVSKCKLSL